jgi:KaiC/GvpD/RAD55 family RecA-like ATPase
VIAFGIAPLDKQFEGVESSTMLVEGVSGCGKAVLGYHLINKTLERGDPCVVVTSTRSPEDVKKDLEYYGMKSSPITWVETAGETLKGENVIQASIGELYTISDAIKKQIAANQGKQVTFVIDVISSAMMSSNVQQVYKFYTSITQELKKGKAVGYVLMELQMHDPKDIAAMEHVSDTVLEFIVQKEEAGTKRGFMIKKEGGRPVPDKVFNFKLTEKGLEITE